MIAPEKVLYVFALLVLGLPIPLLGYSWYRWQATPKVIRARDIGLLLLVIATLSYLFALLGLVFEDFIGLHHSSRRMLTIDANLGLMAVITVWAALSGSPPKRALLVSFAAVILVWAYIATVSSVV